eukprot:1077366-Rhodomonas_salina.2
MAKLTMATLPLRRFLFFVESSTARIRPPYPPTHCYAKSALSSYALLCKVRYWHRLVSGTAYALLREV